MQNNISVNDFPLFGSKAFLPHVSVSLVAAITLWTADSAAALGTAHPFTYVHVLTLCSQSCDNGCSIHTDEQGDDDTDEHSVSHSSLQLVENL